MTPIKEKPIVTIGGCPKCSHGLQTRGEERICTWCGWPNLDSQQEETQRFVKELKESKK